MKKYNITIVGPTFSGNKGSATMLVSGIENLQKILTVNKFHVFSYYPKKDRDINPYKKVEIYSISPLNLVIKLFPLALIYRIFTILNLPGKNLERFKEIRAIKNSDIVIDMAGVSFIDERKKFLPFNILTIWIALLLDKPVVKYSQALGPFNHPLNKMAATFFLPKMKLIFARGKITENYLKSLRLNNVMLAADGGFCLKSSGKDKQFAEKIKLKNKVFFGKKIVGISPSSVISQKCQKVGLNYEEILAQFCKYLIKSGINILLIPYSIRQNSSSNFNNDLPTCLQISNLVDNPKHCLVIEEDLPPQKLNMIIKLVDFFIASRFHSMVASLSMGIPTIVCGWSHKYQEVLNMFELEKYAFSYKELSLKILEIKFTALKTNKLSIEKKIQKNLILVRKSSFDQIMAIKNLLTT